MKNQKFFNGLEDNFEVESRMIEFGINPEMTFGDLSESEKEEIFGKESFDLDFKVDLSELFNYEVI